MDIAIKHPASDKLGRRDFANSLARQIWEISNLDEGYVIGLEAEWGAGKSSVVNMTLLHLLHLEMQEESARPAFIGDVAAPYSLDQLDELAEHYAAVAGFNLPDFGLSYMHPDHYNRSIAKHAFGDSNLAQQIYRYFRLRFKATTRSRNLIVHFRPWLVPDTAALSTVFIEELTKSIGARLGTDVEVALKHYSEVIRRFAPVAGVAAQAVVPGAGTIIRDFFASAGSRTDPTLEARKVTLEGALRGLHGQKVVVIIDDLDRLSPREAVEMVGLVKSLGNLPNVLYFMSYDPMVLSSHIRRVLRVSGDPYLEKIIQYRRRLPLLSPDRLQSLFDVPFSSMFDGMGEVLRDRLNDAMFQVARQYIRTPRDAIRVGDWAVKAHQCLKGQTDPVDLFILEILNAKDPQLYQWIRENIDILCDVAGPGEGSFENELIAASVTINEARKRSLSQLFPLASREFYRPANKSSNPRASKRLCIREFSDAYFALSEPITSFSKQILSDLLSNVSPEEAFHDLVEVSINSKNGAFLRADLLETLLEHFTIEQITPEWGRVLTKEAPRLIVLVDKTASDVFAADNLRRLAGAITNGLERKTPEKKVEFLLGLVNLSTDLSLISFVLRRFEFGENKNEDDESFIAGRDELHRMVLEKIVIAAGKDEVLSAAYPPHILFLWRDLTDDFSVRKHIENTTNARRHFTAIAQTLLSKVNSSSEGLYFSLSESASVFADISEIESWADELMKSGSSDEVTWAERFRDACRRAREGR